MSTDKLILIFVLLLLALTGVLGAVVGFTVELLGWVLLIVLGAAILRRGGFRSWWRQVAVPLGGWIDKALPADRRAGGGSRPAPTGAGRRNRRGVRPPR